MVTMHDVFSDGGVSSFKYPDYSSHENEFIRHKKSFLDSVECANVRMDKVFSCSETVVREPVVDEKKKREENLVASREVAVELTNVGAPVRGEPAMQRAKAEAKMDDSIFGPPDVCSNFPPKEAKPKQIQAAGEDDIFGPPIVAAANEAPPVAAPAAKESIFEADLSKPPTPLSTATQRMQEEEDQKAIEGLVSKKKDVFDAPPVKSNDFNYDEFNAAKASVDRSLSRVLMEDEELVKVIEEARSVKCFEPIRLEAHRLDPKQLLDWSIRVRARLDYVHSLQVKVSVYAQVLSRQLDRLKKVAKGCSTAKNEDARLADGDYHIAWLIEKFELASAASGILELCHRELSGQAQFLSRQMIWFEERKPAEKALYPDALASDQQQEDDTQEQPQDQDGQIPDTDDFLGVEMDKTPVEVPGTENLERFDAQKAKSKGTAPTGTSVVSFGDF